MRQLLQDTCGHNPALTGGKFVFVVTTGDVKTNLCPSITGLILEGITIVSLCYPTMPRCWAGITQIKSVSTLYQNEPSQVKSGE